MISGGSSVAGVLREATQRQVPPSPVELSKEISAATTADAKMAIQSNASRVSGILDHTRASSVLDQHNASNGIGTAINTEA